MAKIIGNTTATPNPRPNWEQNDQSKADYIINKPDLSVYVTEEWVKKYVTAIMTGNYTVVNHEDGSLTYEINE